MAHDSDRPESKAAEATHAEAPHASRPWIAPVVHSFDIEVLTQNSCAGGDDGLGGGS